MLFNIIVCCDSKYGIGKKNMIPWKYVQDIKNFKNLTIGNKLSEDHNLGGKYNIVIMGNNTYKSIPGIYKPLKNRINIILSNSNIPTSQQHLENYDYIITNPIYFNNISLLLLYINSISNFTNECYIIGGNQIYNIFLNLKIVNKIYLTKITEISYNCDIIFNFNKYCKQFKLHDACHYLDIDKNTGSLNTLVYNI